MSSRNAIYLPYYHDAMDIGKLMTGHGKSVEGLDKHATAVLFSTMKGKSMTTFRDRTLFTILYDTGARVSEILHVRIKDMFLDRAQPHVIVTGKGDKRRTLLLSAATVKLLNDFIINAHGHHPRPDGYLFYSRTKGRRHPLGVDAVNCRLKVYAKMAHEKCPEIPKDLHTHQLRHSACTHWFQDGINLAKISRYLGHESIETTRIYLGISREELAEALSKRQNVLPETDSKYKVVKGGLRSLICKNRV